MSIKISAAEVKKLRKETGAGMMDCKKALVETQGDFQAAIDYLRKKGQKMTAKRADRDAKEGVIIAVTSPAEDKGILIRLSCETDFVAKNETFITFAQRIANVALESFPATREELLHTAYDDATIVEKVTESTAVIAEKIELSAYERIEAPKVVAYTHMGYRAGVIVGFNRAEVDSSSVGKDIAMQIAAMHPVAVDKTHIDPEIVAKELEIGMEQARNQGKPDHLVQRIAQSKLQTFFKEKTLLHQEFVKDHKKTVQQYLRSIARDLTVTAFKHLKLG